MPPLCLLGRAGRHFSSTVGAWSQQEHDRSASTQAQPPQTAQLTEEEAGQLAAVLLKSFKQDPGAAAGILAKSLTRGQKRELITAFDLEPGLSR